MLNMHIILLGLVQGATEFLPVSSSAHLALMPKIMGWADQGLGMDVAMHFGTLLAVVIYFFKDFLSMVRGTIFFNPSTKQTQLVMKLFVAMVPALFIGYLIYEHIDSLRNLKSIACLLIGFGFLLYLADRLSPSVKQMEQITYFQALIIGFGQSIALMPGVSRSGITMTIARFFGINRTDSARFSMLLAIPTILAASIYTFYKAYVNDVAFDMNLLSAIFWSCLFGLVAIWTLMKLLQKCSFAIFFGYRLVLGVILLAFAYNLI